MRTLTVRPWTTLVLALLATACDKGGIYGLGVERDVVGVCTTPSSAWIRTTDERPSWVTLSDDAMAGTEVLLVGSSDPTATAALDGADITTGRCFARGYVQLDSSTQLDVGTYELDGSTREGTFAANATFTFNYDAHSAVLNRTGSTRADHSPPVMHPLSVSLDTDGTLLATVDGETRRYTNLFAVLHRLDPTTESGAMDIFRMYNLPLFISQPRLLGFGGAGMTQYVRAPGTFVGLIAGSFHVSVDAYLSPTTHISYMGFRDLTGIVVPMGEQITYPNLSGDGTLSGVLPFIMYGELEEHTTVLSGTVDYGNLIIRNGVAADGSYTLNLDHPASYSYTIPYTLASDEDLRGALPVTTP